MVQRVIDKVLLRRRQVRASARSGPGAEFLLHAAVGELTERLAAVERRFTVGVAIAPQSDALASAMLGSGRVERVFRIEPAWHAGGSRADLIADDEALPLAPGSVDLIVSALSLHWANDLPGALIQARQALRPDGLFLAALAGGQTLTELRQALVEAETEILGGASPRVIPMADVRDLGQLLQRAGFALPVADRDTLTVRYDSAFGLFADLRAMGASNPLIDRTRNPAGRRLFARAAQAYEARFSDPDGRVRATFELIYVAGWAPDASQQKPARRGSAQVNLADFFSSRPST